MASADRLVCGHYHAWQYCDVLLHAEDFVQIACERARRRCFVASQRMSDGVLSIFWKKRVVAPLVNQLTQGVTPKHLALSCALGIALGLFPIIGSTTLLCFLAAFFLKLNQPAIQAVNYLVYPAQIAMVPVFVRIGERIFQAERVTFSPTQLAREFAESPSLFFSKYGMAGVHGITAWAIFAPLIAGGLYYSLVPVFRKMAPVK
jgi:uncharacterized protein (DUF2062 family)